MKTVGIITTFRQPNFGSVLQAFALQKTIDKLGYHSLVIDYKYPNEFHYVNGDKFKRFKTSWRHPLKLAFFSLLEFLGLKTIPKMKLLNQFISREMNCTIVYEDHKSLHQKPPVFDVYVSGSDQIWNPNTMFGDMSYLFDFAPAGSKIISYSSSFSCNHIPDKYRAIYVKNLSRYSAISVRESNGCKLVKDLISKEAELVLDPTLLLSEKDWEEYSKQSRKLKLPSKFILFYMLAYTYDPESKMIELLRYTKEKYQLPIVALSRINQRLGNDVYYIEDQTSIGIYEFIELFKSAEIVITSSFHGTAFSLNFGKPFLTLQNGKSDSDDRISSLLDSLHLQSQLILTTSQINDNISPFYDESRLQYHLQEARDQSLKFLKNALNN